MHVSHKLPFYLQAFILLASGAAAVSFNVTCFNTGLAGDCSAFINNFCNTLAPFTVGYQSTCNTSMFAMWCGMERVRADLPLFFRFPTRVAFLDAMP